MKLILTTLAASALLSLAASASDIGYPLPPPSPYPPEPGYPGTGNSPVYPSPYPTYPNDPYPYPDYPQPGFPSPQPFPHPQPPAPHYPPAPQPPRVCNLTTTCQATCSWRPSANDYQRICTVIDCHGAVVRYQAQSCVPGQNQPAPQPGQDQDDAQQQKPGMEVVYTTTAQTYFKAEPVASSQLGSHKKCLLGVGTLIEGKILVVRSSDRLVKISLKSDIDGCASFGKTGQIGYVFRPHVSLN